MLEEYFMGSHLEAKIYRLGHSILGFGLEGFLGFLRACCGNRLACWKMAKMESETGIAGVILEAICGGGLSSLAALLLWGFWVWFWFWFMIILDIINKVNIESADFGLQLQKIYFHT